MGEAFDVDQSSNKGSKNVIRLLIRHPTMGPERISSEMGIEPTSSWLVGTERRTPTGRSLGTYYQDNMWNYARDIGKEESVSSQISSFLLHMRARQRFLCHVFDTGGLSTFCLEFSGMFHIGGVISLQDLEFIAATHISIGVEIFPD
jgi:hypothetical protein